MSSTTTTSLEDLYQKFLRREKFVHDGETVTIDKFRNEHETNKVVFLLSNGEKIVVDVR